MNTDNPLGQETTYPKQYDASLLFPILRAKHRTAWAEQALPFDGYDVWHAYELSWLEPSGKPKVALARLQVPCHSKYLVESKSLKLYLNSFNQSTFENALAVEHTLTKDISQLLNENIRVCVTTLEAASSYQTHLSPPGQSIDSYGLTAFDEHPNPGCLKTHTQRAPITETLYSDLLKTNCLVTGQPDWASVVIHYKGPAICRAGLLRYLVSYRNHQGFHEPCVEQIFMDIWQRCQPENLCVYGAYTRRGGIDINPLRYSHKNPLADLPRLVRQ